MESPLARGFSISPRNVADDGKWIPTRFVSYFLIILLLGIVLLVANDASLAYSDVIGRGVSVADVPVGGLTTGEAERKVNAALRQRQSKPLSTLRYEDKTWEVPWDAFTVIQDPSQLVRQAYTLGRTGNLLQRLQEQFVAIHGGSSVPLGLTANRETLQAIVANAAQTIDRPAMDAEVVESSAGLRVTAEQPGLRTDVTATVQRIARKISEGSAVSLPLVVAKIPPGILAKDLQEIDGMLASFSTAFNSADSNRSHNIQVAAGNFSGVLVKSGDVLSFNEMVGLRLAERGYLLAPTLSSEGVVMDWGGGVCQVSSTLYNAALLADFAVVERSAHYQPPAYVPLGQDATVADGQLDLKLKNERARPVYIRSFFEAGRLEIRIYGKMENDAPTVKIESVEKAVHVPQTIIKQDPALDLGVEVVESEGRNGFNVTVQRVKKQGAREVSREKISTDEFQGENRIVRVGTRTVTGQAGK